MERKKPKFFRQDWHKKIKLGSQVKKKRVWRAPKGDSSKIRLGRAGKSRKPKVGWGNNKKMKGMIFGTEAVRVENIKQIESAKEKSVIIGRVGRKKREELIKKAEEMKIKILNKYTGTKCN